ncbi:CLUMA_CG005868, isoform A [Clunio marinus]|uniref:CLUMA_CG005868, isoform A n=1 Tax=Clunio marinus TaxID=568069 RepID=A0A1J1HWA1_9DIPT|nr:CLUMA_CG005868, isoform A [Clunio marinus]
MAPAHYDKHCVTQLNVFSVSRFMYFLQNGLQFLMDIFFSFISAVNEPTQTLKQASQSNVSLLFGNSKKDCVSTLQATLCGGSDWRGSAKGYMCGYGCCCLACFSHTTTLYIEKAVHEHKKKLWREQKKSGTVMQ